MLSEGRLYLSTLIYYNACLYADLQFVKIAKKLSKSKGWLLGIKLVLEKSLGQT
jgi:hypothetical protein